MQAVTMMQPEAVVMGFSPPPISGMSTTGGVEAYLQMRGSGTLQDLEAAANKFVRRRRQAQTRTARASTRQSAQSRICFRPARAALRQS